MADGSEVSYAELEAEAAWVARRLAAYGVRRDATVALTTRAGREQVVLIHALMKLGAVVLPLSPRLTPAEREAVIAAEQPAVDLDDPARQLTQTEADLPLLGEHDMDALQCRILTSGSSGAPQPSASHTATRCGVPSAPPSTSASCRRTAGSAACR